MDIPALPQPLPQCLDAAFCVPSLGSRAKTGHLLETYPRPKVGDRSNQFAGVMGEGTSSEQLASRSVSAAGPTFSGLFRLFCKLHRQATGCIDQLTRNPECII